MESLANYYLTQVNDTNVATGVSVNTSTWDYDTATYSTNGHLYFPAGHTTAVFPT